MYRKLLYNEDCILNTISNTIIFNFDDEWKLYLEWANSNINLVKEDIVKKNNILLWNGGIPKEETTDKGKISTTCDESGNLIKRRTVSGEFTTTEIFHSSGKIRTEIAWKNSDIIKACTYDVNGILMTNMFSSPDDDSITENSHDKQGIITKSITKNPSLKTKLIKVFDDKGNLFTLTNYRNDNLNGVHKVFDWSRGVRNIKKECFYSVFSKTQTIRANFYIDDDRPVISMNYKYIYHNTVNGNFLSESYERRKDGKYDVINFFHGTETVRAKGVQWFNDSDIELEHGWLQGKWTFYHSSGTKESEHTFLNNRLITSSIYYEDNTLIQKIEHAQ